VEHFTSQPLYGRERTLASTAWSQNISALSTLFSSSSCVTRGANPEEYKPLIL
jgi:hypothetical protein